MCRASLRLICCGLLALAGCTLPRDADSGGSDATVSPDVISGCALFAGSTTAISVGASVALPNGATLWTFDAAFVSGGRSDGVAAVAQIQANGCPGTLAGAAAALPANGTDTDFAKPLDLVRVGDDVWQFYETWQFAAGAPFGVKTTGRGVARWDAAQGRFIRAAALLWTADRPPFGSAALGDGGWVYAYGCNAADSGWSRACYVARAPEAQLANGAAWQYATAVNTFTANIDDAQPILTGVGDIAVRRHADGRLLVTYFKPLDTVLQVRAALAPTGPFSAPHPLATCDAPPNAFCVGAAQHPELDLDAATIAVTYARASFDPLADVVRWPRLALLPLPADLP